MITSYNITPETGGSINRTPNTWKVQGWNGYIWITIDSQSGFTIDDWTSNYSRNFNIKSPRKYKKFRLYVESVNGSNVTSIRKFKIFGDTDQLSKKIGTIMPTSQISDISIINDLQVKIFPNPSNGDIWVEIEGMYIQENKEPIDSSAITGVVSQSRISRSEPDNGANFIIYDLSGKQVYSKMVNENKLNLNLNLNKGIYLLKVVYENKECNTKLIIN